MVEAIGILLWVAIGIYGLVPLFLGWPFRRMRGAKEEVILLAAVYIFLVAATILGLFAGDKPNFSGDAESIRSIGFGILLAILFNVRFFEWMSAMRRKWSY